MENSHIRGGYGSIRPYLYAKPDMEGFIQTVFGATILARHDTPIGAHVEATIGDSWLIIETAQSFPEHINPTIGSVYIYVSDVDAAYAAAIEAGATAISAPEDKPYDERQCGIKDTFGNTWWISTYVAPIDSGEMS